MANKYIGLVSGIRTLVEGLVQSAGVGDAGKIPALDATGKLHTSLMPVGIGADTATVLASENLSAGDFVNIYDNAGTANVRKADGSTTGKEVVGFVLEAVTSGNNASVYFEGKNTQLTGLTVGGRYYLSDATAGAITATPLTTAGHVHQYVGKAISATEISFEADDYVVLA